MRVNVNKIFKKKRFESGFIMASGVMLTLVLAILPVNIMQNHVLNNNPINIKHVLDAQNNLEIDNFSSIEYSNNEISNATKKDNYDVNLNCDDYKNSAKQGKIINGNVICDNATISLGPTYIKGNLEIKNLSSVELLGVVYVEGKILIKNFVKILGGYPLISENMIEISNFSNIKSPNNKLTPIISRAYNNEAIILNNGVKCFKTLVMAANGGIYIKNISMLYGKAVGKDIKLLNLSKAKSLD